MGCLIRQHRLGTNIRAEPSECYINSQTLNFIDNASFASLSIRLKLSFSFSKKGTHQQQNSTFSINTTSYLCTESQWPMTFKIISLVQTTLVMIH